MPRLERRFECEFEVGSEAVREQLRVVRAQVRGKLDVEQEFFALRIRALRLSYFHLVNVFFLTSAWHLGFLLARLSSMSGFSTRQV